MRRPRLVYAATARCPCGAGLAYDRRTVKETIGKCWDCSAILLGTAIPSGEPGAVQHTARLPFVFWEIKCEGQPWTFPEWAGMVDVIQREFETIVLNGSVRIAYDSDTEGMPDHWASWLATRATNALIRNGLVPA